MGTPLKNPVPITVLWHFIPGPVGSSNHDRNKNGPPSGGEPFLIDKYHRTCRAGTKDQGVVVIIKLFIAVFPLLSFTVMVQVSCPVTAWATYSKSREKVETVNAVSKAVPGLL